MKVEHGGNVFALAKDLGYDLKDCLDFSANINPFGLSMALKESIITSLDQLTHYPDIHYNTAKKELANYHGVNSGNVLIANGAVEIFYDLARVIEPKKVLLLQPTFMEYEKAFLQVGSELTYLTLREPNYSWDAAELLACLEGFSKGDLVLICNPNNPTGTLVSNKELEKISSHLGERGIWFVIDEAFVDFLDEESEYSFISHLSKYENSIIVRSLTKFYAIPGLRLGYAISYHPTCLNDIDNRRPPWTVNALAEAALPAILGDYDYQKQTRQWLKEEKDYLFKALSDITDIRPLKPSVNYVFFKYLGDLDLREELRKNKIFIRSCANYHSLTDKHYRIAVRSRQENDQLIRVLKELLGSETS